jgi:hypothetical protein
MFKTVIMNHVRNEVLHFITQEIYYGYLENFLFNPLF